MGPNGDDSMETAVTSIGRTVKIGPEHPFVIIGERINPTGRKSLSAEMAAGNFERVRADALAQVAAGATPSGSGRNPCCDPPPGL